MKKVKVKIPIETSVEYIPERLKEIDPRLVVYFNTSNQMYEVYGVDVAGVEYRLGAWPYLDIRVLRAIRKAYWVANNTGDPYKEHIRELDEADYREDKKLTKETEELLYKQNDFLRWINGQWRGWGGA